jgi:2-succinyl-6-hydroxy-2,4-cyclohexadiene-1-carboxylate synthase
MSLLSVQREGSGSSFVWLHGFTQTRASAHQFRSILAGSHELLTLDLPGHGSAQSLTGTLEETADLVALVLPDEPVALGGYSFGGRVALHVALRHPERVDKLVLLSATRGIENESLRTERRARDEALAARIEDIGTDAFLHEWLSQPMFANLPHDPIERAARSRNAQGLANSLRWAGTGTQSWLEPHLAKISADTLTIAGANDEKFSVEARAIAAGVNKGREELVNGAAHAAHLEMPGVTARLIDDFLES